jgi:hypothetical protein
LSIELDYSPGAPQYDVPRLYSTHLRIHSPVAEGQSGLPSPFTVQGAKTIECILKGVGVLHRCADSTLDSLQGARRCARWNYVVADMTALGFQNENQMEESLPLVITRHNLFEAFVGADSPLGRQPFPHLEHTPPVELEGAQWIWIKDPGFTAWFAKETGKTVAARASELGAQASQDKCLEILLQWATDPESPTLEYAHATSALLVLTTAINRDLKQRSSNHT